MGTGLKAAGEKIERKNADPCVRDVKGVIK